MCFAGGQIQKRHYWDCKPMAEDQGNSESVQKLSN